MTIRLRDTNRSCEQCVWTNDDCHKFHWNMNKKVKTYVLISDHDSLFRAKLTRNLLDVRVLDLDVFFVLRHVGVGWWATFTVVVMIPLYTYVSGTPESKSRRLPRGDSDIDTSFRGAVHRPREGCGVCL